MPEEKKCERCDKGWQVELNDRPFCYQHGKAFLNEKIDSWNDEYNNPSTSHSRKRYLWFYCILPAMEERDHISQLIH